MTALGDRLHVRRRTDLLAEGRTRTELDALVARGALVRLGRSWYGTALTPPDVAAALARGTRLTCVSALRLHGLWIPLVPGRHEIAHRSRAPAAEAGSGPPGVVGHGVLRAWPDHEPILPVRTALAHALRCVPALEAKALLESAANTGALRLDEVEELADALPGRARRAIGRLDARAQSGTETIVRHVLERMRVAVQPQALIPGVGFVDLLVGDPLVIECDSRAHHTGEAAYAEDRRRDLELVARGYTVVRLTWADVMHGRDRTAATLRELIRAGRHRRARGVRR